MFSKKNNHNKVILILATAITILVFTGCKEDIQPLSPSEIPSNLSVSPNEGTVGTELTITGDNFKSDAAVFVDNIICSLVEVSTDNIIYAVVPSGIPANALLSVTVKNPGGGENSLANAFKAISPELHFVNSATKPSGNAGSTVIIEGKAFGDIQGSGQVLFSDGSGGTITAPIASQDDWTETFIVTTVPNEAQSGPIVVKTEIGTSNSLQFNVTEVATFSPSVISWTLTSDLPQEVSGHSALSIKIDDDNGITNQYVNVSGGRTSDSSANNQIVFGKINNDGTIDFWTSTVSMPAALSFHAAAAATPFNSKVSGSGYIYILGGIDNSGTIVSTVSFSTLNNDGTIQGGWNNTTPLPQPLYSTGALIFRGSIYITGGSTTGNIPVKTVYRAKINEQGMLSEWEILPELPAALAHHGFVAFGSYLYCVGGDNADVDPDADSQSSGSDNIFYSKIDLRTGTIGNWLVNPTVLGKQRSKHTTLVLGGNLFISSGIYAGLSGNVQGSSENIYAVINADGTTGSFNGATGSNTLFTAGGNNLFNQAGISYIDANGVAHIMILGGAKIGSPSTKLDNVLFY